MSNKISIQLQGFTFPGRFAEVCTYCGNPRTSEIVHKIPVPERENNQTINHEIELHIPYCDEHMRIARRNQLIDTTTLTAGVVMGMIIGGLVGLWSYSDIGESGIFGFTEGPMFSALWFLGVVAMAGFAGAAAMFVLMLLLSSITKLVVRMTTKFPADNPLGVLITTTEDSDSINFAFHLDDIASAFREANSELAAENLS